MEAIYNNIECVKLDNPTPSTNYTGKKEVIEQVGYNISYYYWTFVWVTCFLSSFQVRGALRKISIWVLFSPWACLLFSCWLELSHLVSSVSWAFHRYLFYCSSGTILMIKSLFLKLNLINSIFFISDHNLAGHVSAEAEKRDLLNKNIFELSNQLSSMTEERDFVNKNFSALSNQLSSMTEERDLLSKKTEELKKLLCFYNQSESLCELFCL